MPLCDEGLADPDQQPDGQEEAHGQHCEKATPARAEGCADVQGPHIAESAVALSLDDGQWIKPPIMAGLLGLPGARPSLFERMLNIQQIHMTFIHQ
jgi:hypothetical protein